MDKYLSNVKQIWELENITSLIEVSEHNINSFNQIHGLIIPNDLSDYFTEINGTNENYDSRFFKFYPHSHFKSIGEHFKNWEGTPNYNEAKDVIDDSSNCFIFADYMCYTFSYAIHLYPKEVKINEIYIICGDEYKVIASSFSEFIELYLLNDKSLYFQD
jgi:hypothetical protein